MERFKTFLPLGLTVLYIIVGCVFFEMHHFLFTPPSNEKITKIVYISRGMTLKEVAQILNEHRLISDSDKFIFWTRILGLARRIKAGEYQLNTTMSPKEVLSRLIKGITLTYKVTIPEGYNLFQVAKLLSQKGLGDEERFIQRALDPEFANSLGVEGVSLEGYLYPDTYAFHRGMYERDILRAMVSTFFTEYNSKFKERVIKIGLSQREVIILASMVEKETSIPEERSLIASVFLNRLKKGMRLRCDPTVIYGMVCDKRFLGNITKKDLKTMTPYNTYLIHGLPAGPIANPGNGAIQAVLYPADTDYLYFVSKNDGTHHFSRDLKEHNRAVLKYQKMNHRNVEQVNESGED